MPIARKPAVAKKPAPVKDVDALISRGGSPARSAPPADDKPVAISVRIPAALVSRIDSQVSRRSVKIPRHTWILEALAEKADRDEGK